MKIFAISIVIAAALAVTFAGGVFADEIDAITAYYNGLADVIEQNRNDPDVCVQKAEEFMRDKSKLLNDAVTSAQNKAAQSQPSAEDVDKFSRQHPLQQGTTMNAMQRFSVVFGIFQQKHPEQAAKITQIAQEYSEKAMAGRQ